MKLKRTIMIIAIVLASLLMVVGFLFYFLIGPVEKVEPQIVTLKEPIKMIGVSTRTSMKTIFKDATKLGQAYKSIKDQGLVKNKVEPWAFVAISKDFKGLDSWEYLMGDVVTNLDTIPSGLKSFEIPAITYAVFPIRPKSAIAWGITIGRMKKYIYTEWITKSNYELDNLIIGDFEYHDARSESKNPEIDLYVAIKEKKI